MTDSNSTTTFETFESNVRGYCRSFPTVFKTSRGCWLVDEEGREYIDFFAGAGALNYGHNHPVLKDALLRYIQEDGITHALDMATSAKRAFIETFQKVILQPRDMQYKLQFPGPTGTNAVEAAMKLARKITGRSKMLSFTNAFHGMTLGSLSVTGNAFKRSGAGVDLTMALTMPFDGYFEDGTDTIEYMDRLLSDSGSGVDFPAAAIIETVQAEGGINVASAEWLRRLEQLCRRHDMLLIVDDIQVGCGRTGTFFSFEEIGLNPDIICLSKSLSGYGLPMALTLIRPEHDLWEPGEHNGTFRGNNPAFVTATAALNTFWKDGELAEETARKGELVREFLTDTVKRYPELHGTVRGRGLIQGIECAVDGLSAKICHAAFERGLIIETAGPESKVFKLLPALVIDDTLLRQGFDILRQSIEAVLESEGLTAESVPA